MATKQITSRCGSLQRSSTCPKPKSYSATQVLRSHHEVGLPSYIARLWRVHKGFCYRNGRNNSLSSPTLPPLNLMPHSLFLGIGYLHNSIVKNLGRTFTKFLQESCKDLGKIIARFVERISNNHARSMQDSCKIVAKFLQKLSKNFALFFQACWKTLQELFKILIKIIQDTCKILPISTQDFARIIQGSGKNYPRIFQDSCKILARLLAS